MDLTEKYRRAEVRKVLGPTSVVELDLDILATIHSHKDVLTFGKIVEVLGSVKSGPINKSTVSQALGRLEAREFVTRNYNPNPRTPQVSLTASGRVLAQKLAEINRGVEILAGDVLGLDSIRAHRYQERLERAIRGFRGAAFAQDASPARVYDFLIGGSHNGVRDRDAAEKLLKILPGGKQAALDNRSFLRRATMVMARHDIRQFVDIGAGLPTEWNTHQVLEAELGPDVASVAYVDSDPEVVEVSNALLAAFPRASIILGDAAFPNTYWDSLLELQPTPFDRSPDREERLIDASAPIGILMVAVLHFVTDDRRARDAIQELLKRVPRGSYIAVSHGTTDGLSKADADHLLQVYEELTKRAVRLRSRAEFADMLSGVKLTPDGICYAPAWRPDITDTHDARSHSLASEGFVPPVLVAVGQKE
jgi:Mn-dependent DtxR family transcriptional regulator